MVYSSNTTNRRLRDSGSVPTQNTTQKCALGILANFFPETVIISNGHWKILDKANRQLALRFEKLQKARASRDLHGIQNAEMDYSKHCRTFMPRWRLLSTTLKEQKRYERHETA